MAKKKTETAYTRVNLTRAEAFATELAKYSAAARKKMLAAMEERIAFLENERIEQERREAETRDARLNDPTWNYKRVITELFDTVLSFYDATIQESQKNVAEAALAYFDAAVRKHDACIYQYIITRDELEIATVELELTKGGILSAAVILKMLTHVRKTTVARIIADMLGNRSAFVFENNRYVVNKKFFNTVVGNRISARYIKCDKYDTYKDALKLIADSYETADEFTDMLNEILNKNKEIRAAVRKIHQETDVKCKALTAEAVDFTNAHILKYLKRCEIRNEGN